MPNPDSPSPPSVPQLAAHHLCRRVPVARREETAGELCDRLRREEFEAVELVCLVDGAGRLTGVVRLPALLAAAPGVPLGELAEPDPAAARLEDDQERVAGLAVRGRASAVPVVDAEGVFQGVVPATAIIDILRREHIEDLHLLAGIRSQAQHAATAMEAPPLSRVRDRLPWLLVGLAGSFVAAAVVDGFADSLRRRLAVGFFVPAIVYLADAIGTQTEAIAVRGLSLSHAPFRRLLAGEVLTGAAIGLCLGAAAIPGVALFWGDLRLALAVGLAILTAGTVATGIGLLLPWLLSLRRLDPALGSGPLATIVQDVLSLVIYFVIAGALLR